MDDSPQYDPLTGEELAPAIAASTLVLLRPGESAPEILMVVRSKNMVFAGGAAVFPGGRVDDADYDFAAEIWQGDNLAEGAARIAAIREMLEETGVAYALSATTEAETLRSARAALHAGETLKSVCQSYGWHPQLDLLVPWARWRPPFNERRIFDTQFYLGDAGDAVGEAFVDETENFRLFWASAAQVLDMAAANEVKIIFPTRRNLERLASYNSYAALTTHAAAHQVGLIVPFIEERDGESHLCIADNLGYTITSEPIAGAMRG